MPSGEVEVYEIPVQNFLPMASILYQGVYDPDTFESLGPIGIDDNWSITWV